MSTQTSGLSESRERDFGREGGGKKRHWPAKAGGTGRCRGPRRGPLEGLGLNEEQWVGLGLCQLLLAEAF